MAGVSKYVGIQGLHNSINCAICQVYVPIGNTGACLVEGLGNTINPLSFVGEGVDNGIAGRCD